MKPIEDILKYQFKNSQLLKDALTHKSFAKEQGQTKDNERLEFLGDAVLQLAITDILMKRFPQDHEGHLSKKRAYLVGEPCLALIAKELQIPDFLCLSKGEVLTKGHNKPRLLSSALEAIIGAIYIDSGLINSRAFIERVFNEELKNISHTLHHTHLKDYKTQLQEMTWQRYQCIPQYDLTQTEGPDHNKIFYTDVLVNKKIIAKGSGKSKREAQQMAAYNALTTFT